MLDFPQSLDAFEAMFPDDSACAEWLFEARWPNGFRCPDCGEAGRRQRTRPLIARCGACKREVSVTAGTLMHRTHLPLKIWFRAAWLMATHKNGISGRQLQAQLGLGSYKTAWLLLHKLRKAMVDPNRTPLCGLVEIDETSMPHRKTGAPVGGGRSTQGAMAIAGAVESRATGPGRVRLAVIQDYSAATLERFAAGGIGAGAAVISDGWQGYSGLAKAVGAVAHEVKVVGATAAHRVLPWIHRLFANLKRWALGVYHGLRPRHLQAYLDEFVFRFNRRRNPKAAFARLLGLAAEHPPITYKMLISMP